MGLRAGILTEPIIIQQLTTTKSDFGDEIKSWSNYLSTRCSVKSYSGNRQTENMEIVNTYNITFTVRNYYSLNESMRIIWKEKHYRILAILPDKFKQSTDIIGELINE